VDWLVTAYMLNDLSVAYFFDIAETRGYLLRGSLARSRTVAIGSVPALVLLR